MVYVVSFACIIGMNCHPDDLRGFLLMPMFLVHVAFVKGKQLFGKLYRRVRSGRWTCAMCRRPITWWIKGTLPLCDFHYEARQGYLETGDLKYLGL